jgi:hypothetical protein
MDAEAPWCCFISPDGTQCPQPPAWYVFNGPGYEDYTHACGDHVGALSDKGAKVYPLAADPAYAKAED